MADDPNVVNGVWNPRPGQTVIVSTNDPLTENGKPVPHSFTANFTWADGVKQGWRWYDDKPNEQATMVSSDRDEAIFKAYSEGKDLNLNGKIYHRGADGQYTLVLTDPEADARVKEKDARERRGEANATTAQQAQLDYNARAQEALAQQTRLQAEVAAGRMKAEDADRELKAYYDRAKLAFDNATLAQKTDDQRMRGEETLYSGDVSQRQGDQTQTNKRLDASTSIFNNTLDSITKGAVYATPGSDAAGRAFGAFLQKGYDYANQFGGLKDSPRAEVGLYPHLNGTALSTPQVELGAQPAASTGASVTIPTPSTAKGPTLIKPPAAAAPAPPTAGAPAAAPAPPVTQPAGAVPPAVQATVGGPPPGAEDVGGSTPALPSAPPSGVDPGGATTPLPSEPSTPPNLSPVPGSTTQFTDGTDVWERRADGFWIKVTNAVTQAPGGQTQAAMMPAVPPAVAALSHPGPPPPPVDHVSDLAMQGGWDPEAIARSQQYRQQQLAGALAQPPAA